VLAGILVAIFIALALFVPGRGQLVFLWIPVVGIFLVDHFERRTAAGKRTIYFPIGWILVVIWLIWALLTLLSAAFPV
jgi:hypothetical protein